ncbi:MAG: hypothetical protein R2911_11400 [Caldilineaceae bacterium]
MPRPPHRKPCLSWLCCNAEGLEDFVSYAESSGLADKLQGDELYTLL